MLTKIIASGLTRRTFLKSTAATALSAGLPGAAIADGYSIKIGFLAPLTGPVAAWGKPGLDGCQIWAERVNAASWPTAHTQWNSSAMTTNMIRPRPAPVRPS